MKKLLFGVLVAVLFICNPFSADAAVIDCSAGCEGAGNTSNGAIFTTTNFGSSGTGVISSFVRLQDGKDGCGYLEDKKDPCNEDNPEIGGDERGYNTSGRGVQYEENTSPEFTRDLLKSEIPLVTLDGIVYREFLLDINQNKGSDSEFLTLDIVKIYLEASGGIINDDDFGTAIYEMAAADWIKMNAEFSGSGSGKADLFMYIPNSLFAGDNQYVYLYSYFGLERTGSDFDVNDGFEEWAVFKCTGEGVVCVEPPCEGPDCNPVVPEPTSMILFGTGLVGAVLRKRFSA